MIENGKRWTTISGEDIHAHGGGIIKAGDYYYWYGENRLGNIKVSCYRSTDLVNWEFCNHVLTTESRYEPIDMRTESELHFEESKPKYGEGANIERPKVLYNAQTGKYVMWMHWENGIDYKEARCAIASCDTVDGDYVYHGSFNPIGHMSRDCTLFQDDDGTAYFISAARGNADLHIYRLSPDYLSIEEHVKTLWPGQHREAPALFKKGDYYFMITSGCSGWHPNQSKYAYAKSITGRWSPLKNLGGPTTYDTQPTFVLPVYGTETTTYLYISDRWNPKNYYDSRYVFLPIAFADDTTLSLEWADTLTIDLKTGKTAVSKQDNARVRINSAVKPYLNYLTMADMSVTSSILDYTKSQVWELAFTEHNIGRLKNYENGAYLQTDTTDDGEHQLTLSHEFSEDPRQKWQLLPVQYGWYKIQNCATEQVLQLKLKGGSGIICLSEPANKADDRQDMQCFIISADYGGLY